MFWIGSDGNPTKSTWGAEGTILSLKGRERACDLVREEVATPSCV